MAGGEVMLMRVLPRLRERGWEVRLTVPGPGRLRDAARAAGLETVALPLGPPERRSPASYAGAVAAPVIARSADAVLLNGLPTQRIVRTVSRPAVLHVTNYVPAPPRAWARRGHWDRVRFLACDSDFLARQCVEAGAPAERVRTLHPPAWGGDAPPRPRDASTSAGGRRVGFVGQLEPRKGVGDLLRAADDFLAGRPDATLTVIGEGPVAYASGHERVRFTGFRPDVAEAIAELDVLVVPSLAEPFGTVAAEAAAAAVPVVATRVGGLPEVVRDGETGLLVAPGDPDALAAAVGRLLDDAELRARLGARARELSARFAPERYADALDALLREAAA
jgi:glycosyltransferase involved in cell wall biosynthesis